jgi:hypothetical protein
MLTRPANADQGFIRIIKGEFVHAPSRLSANGGWVLRDASCLECAHQYVAALPNGYRWQ